MYNDVKNIKVLVAEDDAMVAEMTIGVLKELGFTIIGEAEDGLATIRMTKQLKPDVVVMDVHMPNMDGLEATGIINKECPTPVVILSAFESVDFVKKASEKGVGAYIIKPPRAQELERAILISISRFRDLRELQKLNAELQEALDDVKMLSGLIPICSSCKKIRDDEGFWHKLETYISNHSDAKFTHGLCPDCVDKFGNVSETELGEIKSISHEIKDK